MMTAIEWVHYRILFAKTAAMRYTSHLDLQRTWERTFRRADLPLAYSRGFKPRPRINIGSALPLGFTSQAELVDVWFENHCDPEEVKARLTQVQPPGLKTHTVDIIADREPSLQRQITSSQYRVRLDAPPPKSVLQNLIDQLLEQRELRRERRGKSYDLRPLIESLVLTSQKSTPVLSMQLAAREGKTGRPEEVLLAMGLDPTHALIHRTRLILGNP
jgi:radical SAM-linked protein